MSSLIHFEQPKPYYIIRKFSISMGFSILNHWFLGTPILGNRHIIHIMLTIDILFGQPLRKLTLQ